MADAGIGLTWEEKVDHWAIRLVVPALVVWAAVALTIRPEVAWRSAGGALELLGFLLAAYGLQEKLARFTDRPSVRERIIRFLRRRWRRFKMLFGWKPEPITLSAEEGSVAVASGSARATVKAGPDASLDHRLEVLEQEIEAIRSWIKDVEQASREGRSELQDKIDNLRGDLRQLEEKVEHLVARLAVGSLHLEVTGLLWFALGVFFSTWPGALPSI